MNKFINIFFLSIGLCAHALANAETITILNASKNYGVEIQKLTCGGIENGNLENYCSGQGGIQLRNKTTGKIVQSIKPSYLRIDKQHPSFSSNTIKESRQLYGDTYGIVFEDFNFDGQDDLAVWTDNNAGYGGASYEVYLFNPKTKRFIKNLSLSKLTNEPYLGLFGTENKLLVVSSKSGCCYHETRKYRVIRNEPVMVERITQELSASEGFTIQTTYRKVNKRWVKKMSKVKPK